MIANVDANWASPTSSPTVIGPDTGVAMTPRAYEASRTNATYQSRNAALIANTQRRTCRRGEAG